MPPKPKFLEGERVLCFHGPLLYEAKCIELDVKEGKVQYLIHYNGWNKNWDEWVQESRVVKHNDAGLLKQKELLKNHGAQVKKNKASKKLEKDSSKSKTPSGNGREKEKEKCTVKDKETPKEPKEKPSTEKTPKEKPSSKDKEKKEPKQRPSTPQPAATEKKKEKETVKESKDKDKKEKEERDKVSAVPAIMQESVPAALPLSATTGEPKRKRARLDQNVESEETYLTKIEVKIKIPEDLKPVLVDDWDLITRQKMLVILPCKQTVDDIIDDYLKTKTSKNNSINRDAMVETMLGCKDYFNVMLGSQLLYKFERPQYSEILSEYPDKPMSSIYGAIHFLRLFVRLGAMLAYTSLDERTVHILLNQVHDFLKYLSKNGPNFFKISNYEIASPDYHRKAI